MKKDKRKIFVITFSTCGALLSILGIIAADEINLDWENFVGILLGIYLYFVYLLVSILHAEWENPIKNHPHVTTSLPKRKKPVNEMYEF